jgi:hypothetical protein
VFHRTGFAHDFDAFGLQVRAHFVNIIDTKREMAKSVALIVTRRSPIVRQFNDGIVLLIAIANKSQGELPARIILFA